MFASFSLVNFSPNERVSVCVALDQNCRLWYVITSSKTTYYLFTTYLVQMFSPRTSGKTVRFFGPIVCSQTKWIQFNELFEFTARHTRMRPKNIGNTTFRRKKLLWKIFFCPSDRSQQINVVRHSKELLWFETIIRGKTTKKYIENLVFFISLIRASDKPL